MAYQPILLRRVADGDRLDERKWKRIRAVRRPTNIVRQFFSAVAI
jgi:hypothetical protein